MTAGKNRMGYFHWLVNRFAKAPTTPFPTSRFGQEMLQLEGETDEHFQERIRIEEVAKLRIARASNEILYGKSVPDDVPIAYPPDFDAEVIATNMKDASEITFSVVVRYGHFNTRFETTTFDDREDAWQAVRAAIYNGASYIKVLRNEPND